MSVDGVTVSIVAFQAAVPGSTPGRRKFFFTKNLIQENIFKNKFNSILIYFYSKNIKFKLIAELFIHILTQIQVDR